MRSRRALGEALQPVRIEGRAIAQSFWGKAWCDNLECYGDYANRLPRGRTYVRNGSVIDLRIRAGAIDAQVMGSNLYRVEVRIAALSAAHWRRLVGECSGAIGSLVQLLRGQFSREVMEVLTRPESGLFPKPAEIAFSCSCPDWAAMCKHVAAVMYGIGARFERAPELFFTLRAVDGSDLIAAAAGAQGLAIERGEPSAMDAADLGAVFGIEIDNGTAQVQSKPAAQKRRRKRVHAAAPREDDGFAEVFGPDLEVTEVLLAGFGVDARRIRRWLARGVLRRTRKKGVHRTTAATLAHVRTAFAQSAGP